MAYFFEHTKHCSIHTSDESIQTTYLDIHDGDVLLYLHGWGMNHRMFYPLIEALESEGRHIAIDFPGFGESGKPSTVWGSYEYASFVRQLLADLNIASCTLVGHSFGGRVAIQLACHWPELVRRMVLIASAGIKRTVPLRRRLRVKSVQTLAKISVSLLPGSMGQRLKQSLYRTIASSDYLNAGDLQPILVKVVNEDLSGELSRIQTPALLIWGSDDRETPVEMGRGMHSLLRDSRWVELPGFDHYSILNRGSFQTGHQIKRFIHE